MGWLQSCELEGRGRVGGREMEMELEWGWVGGGGGGKWTCLGRESEANLGVVKGRAVVEEVDDDEAEDVERWRISCIVASIA